MACKPCYNTNGGGAASHQATKVPSFPRPPAPPQPPITVAAPSKKRVAPATGLEVEWTETGSLYSVSPPPSSVPMPTTLLLTVTAARKPPTACAVEVAGGGVDVSATDELRRLLRL
ncbi:hypothetical protein GQ55_2G337500 [Panicum hallii var. hallii]|jgi:hypothetical protein|uniref:Uncharacterized protein n=1 Tax=Panicum hallii var. hallii TaxID=1504633 RepID=A0A2T7EV77_9POAL|nr:hypothetical protein GQ55_2G337500 [Panicum hallii var. hallii]